MIQLARSCLSQQIRIDDRYNYDVTSDFDNIVANAKDCGKLFILLLGAKENSLVKWRLIKPTV